MDAPCHLISDPLDTAFQVETGLTWSLEKVTHSIFISQRFERNSVSSQVTRFRLWLATIYDIFGVNVVWNSFILHEIPVFIFIVVGEK